MRWFGYGCFLFSDDNNRVVFDPHDGKSLGIFPPNADADIVICSHNTFARNSFRNIRGNHTDFNTVRGHQSVRGFEFEGFPSTSIYDDGENSIYRFVMDGISVVVCGCLGDIPSTDVLRAISKADIMVVPVGEYSTMPMGTVNRLIGITAPRIVVPSEFKAGGITIPLSNIQAFSEGRDPEEFAYVGNEVEFAVDDIQDYSGVWIFDF